MKDIKDYFTEDISEYLNEDNSNSEHKSYEPIDPFNPFDNPTENRDYNDDYSEIVPQIKLDGCRIPNIPSPEEKKKIRHYYNIAGGGIAVHFLLSLILSNALNLIVMFCIMFVNDISLSEFTGSTSDNIMQYVNTSSISPAITILTYLSANLIVFFFGLKFAGIKFKTLFKTSELTVLKIIQYIFIAFFLQNVAGYAVNFIQMFAANADIMGSAQSLTTYSSAKYAILSILYNCVVAPVTEELLYRGFILKTFSKASQRFGIFISAVFFGLSHGNLAQFILAFAIGIFMAYIDIKHNSVLPSIIVHVAVNVFATLFTAAENLFPSHTLTISMILGIAAILFSIIGLIMLILLCKNNVFTKADIRQQFRSKNIAITSVGVIISAAIYIIFTFAVTFT